MKQKQAFLRDSIMDAGYDVDKFGEFISEKKEGGYDINNWELDELKKVVEEFVETHTPAAHNESIVATEQSEVEVSASPQGGPRKTTLGNGLRIVNDEQNLDTFEKMMEIVNENEIDCKPM